MTNRPASLGVGTKISDQPVRQRNLAYDYTHRATNAADAKFQDNTVTISLNLHD